MYRSSPLRSTLNTGYITGLDMCKVCTEAVHCVALWTRVTLGLDMCKVCTEAVHSVALWTRVTLGLGMCKVCTEALHMPEVCISCSVSFSAQNVSKNNPRLQMHETARPVYEMHINTRFPLGSTSEKMRANEGSEGTTTTTTTTTTTVRSNNNNSCLFVFLRFRTAKDNGGNNKFDLIESSLAVYFFGWSEITKNKIKKKHITQKNVECKQHILLSWCEISPLLGSCPELEWF